MVLRKDEIEAQLHTEHQAISAGKLKDDNPLDTSDSFGQLCEACRRGDLKVVLDKINQGTNINARDRFDYTPLILASLCGRYEVVELLLESGALCERDTFQGERCLYNALNDRIRNLLLSYDFSKSTNPLQPLAAHVTSLLTRNTPKTCDLALIYGENSLQVHKFVLSARSPYFARKLRVQPDITSWRLPNTIPQNSIWTIFRFLYFSDVAMYLGDDQEENEILTGIDKFSRQIQVESLFEIALDRHDRRLTRQRMTDEITRGRDELDAWFHENVIGNKIMVDRSKANDVKWDRSNTIFADVILRADEDWDSSTVEQVDGRCATSGDADSLIVTNLAPPTTNGSLVNNTSKFNDLNGTNDLDVEGSDPTNNTSARNDASIPVGPFDHSKATKKSACRAQEGKSILFPVHKAMLLRSEFFLTMFSSAFKEAQESDYLQIIPIDCSPDVLEAVLVFIYTERADFPLKIAIDVLFVADLLLLDKLKVKAATTISSLATGVLLAESGKTQGEIKAGETEDLINIYDVIRAGWAVRVHKLEEFGARYIADRLENFIEDDEFAQLVKESAQRVNNRQETDTIELIDDIRYYLSERFRLRFEAVNIETMVEDAYASHDAGNTQSVADATMNRGIDERQVQSLQSFPRANDASSVGLIRTLDGPQVDDEFEEDSKNYQILMGKIDALLDGLELDG